MTKETLEEVAESKYGTDMDSIRGGKIYDLNADSKRAFVKGAMWMQERMYSDIEQKWNEYRIITNNEDAWSFKEWLVEQFKKKQDE